MAALGAPFPLSCRHHDGRLRRARLFACLHSTSTYRFFGSFVQLWEYSVVCTYCMEVLPPAYVLVTSPSSYGVIAGSWLRLEASVLPYWPAVITSIRRMTLRVQVFLEFFYWLSLKFSKAPGPLWGVEGRWPWRWWPGCMFQQYIRCCPFLPVVGCLFNAQMSDSQEGRTTPMPGTGGMPRRFAVAAWVQRLCTPSGVHGPRACG